MRLGLRTRMRMGMGGGGGGDGASAGGGGGGDGGWREELPQLRGAVVRSRGPPQTKLLSGTPLPRTATWYTAATPMTQPM